MRTRLKSTATLLVCCLSACNSDSGYEVVERSQKEAPNVIGPGNHTEVHYVLLHGGHKIYATCDLESIGSSDPDASCGFRPLRTYQCILQEDSLQKATFPLSDLKCKDADGHNVYLYVNKKE
jgi:hypothetical protein